MGKYCCAIGCHSDDRKYGNLDKYPWMLGITFWPFPGIKRNRKEHDLWMRAVRREENWRPNYQTRICSRHFVDGGPTPGNPVPTLFQHNNYGGRGIHPMPLIPALISCPQSTLRAVRILPLHSEENINTAPRPGSGPVSVLLIDVDQMDVASEVELPITYKKTHG